MQLRLGEFAGALCAQQHGAELISGDPELLTLLSDEFAAHKFDIKWLLREIAMSEAYQRASRAPAVPSATAPTGLPSPPSPGTA